MINYSKFLILIITILCYSNLDGGLKQFINNSDLIFNDHFDNGLPYKEMLDEGHIVPLTRQGSVLSTVDGNFKMHFNEYSNSAGIVYDGEIWLESNFPFLGQTKIFFVYYDTHSIWTEIGIVVNPDHTITFEPLHQIQQVIYPATSAPRGTPLQKVQWVYSFR